MEFITDFGLLALLIVVIMAFMGIVSTKIIEAFGGKKAKEAYNLNELTKQGWKGVGAEKK